MSEVGKITEIDDDDEDIEDESLIERLVGLTEMFPEFVRNASSSTLSITVKCTKSVYKFSRSALWMCTASMILLVVPVVFEQERFNLEQQQLAQQRQLLLGPNAAVSGALGMQGNPGMAPAPPIPNK